MVQQKVPETSAFRSVRTRSQVPHSPGPRSRRRERQDPSRCFDHLLAVKSFTTLSRGSMFLFWAISRPWFAERLRARAKLDEICNMHDHSRFQRDIDDVTGVSLSLSLSLSLGYSQKSLTHNIGSASALPIIQNLIPHRNFLWMINHLSLSFLYGHTMEE